MNNMKRMRGRNHRGAGGQGGGPIRHQSGNVPLNRNHVFDSSGPDLRVRGTSQQLFEKYLQLGRDATSSGDRVMAESYFQHAEHYFRILNAMNQAAQANPSVNGQGGGQQQHSGRRQQYEPQGEQPQSNEQRGQEGRSERDDGAGRDDDEQGGEAAESRDAREISIAAAPPEG